MAKHLSSSMSELAHIHLSDVPIAPVVPRGQAERVCDQAEDISDEPRSGSARTSQRTFPTKLLQMNLSSSPRDATSLLSTSAPIEPEFVPRKRVRLKSARRRDQCRANQARYRNKQRDHHVYLDESVLQLQQEVAELKQKRQDIVLGERTDHSPWIIVTEVFHVVQNTFRSPWRLDEVEDLLNHAETRNGMAFLQSSFASNVSIGELCGFDKLMAQLHQYSWTLGEPHLRLKKVETVAPGVMAAAATMSVTVSELTLRYVFPHLRKFSNRAEDDQYQVLREQLFGRRLECNFTVDFLFNDESGRVERIEFKTEFVTELLRILGDLEDLLNVCGPARVLR